MPILSQKLALQAIRATGDRLAARGASDPVRVVLCGSMAGILTGQFTEARQTVDCDVIATTPTDGFFAVAEAAAQIAQELGLNPTWLNNDSRMFGWLLPIGWSDRLEMVGTFGPLQVTAISRQDLLALKLVAAVKRPRDLEDLRDLRPGADEIAFLRRYLDRIESESLDRASYDAQRSILNALEAEA